MSKRVIEYKGLTLRVQAMRLTSGGKLLFRVESVPSIKWVWPTISARLRRAIDDHFEKILKKIADNQRAHAILRR